jgi:hypothetical protein
MIIMVETTEIKNKTVFVSVLMVEQQRAYCQKEIVLQYDERTIDEKKLALKLKDLRQYSDVAKDAIGKMQELVDKA